MSDENFIERVLTWKSIAKNCPAKFDSRPVPYCLITGQPCCFWHCPRRVFEKQLKATTTNQKVEKLVHEINNINREVNEIISIVGKLRKDVLQLLKEKSP